MRLPGAILTALLLAVPAAWAQSVALQGVLGNRALLIVDGAPPTLVGVGETYKGVKVLSVSSEQATMQAAGVRFSIRLGASQASVSAAASTPAPPASAAVTAGAFVASSGRIVLTAGTGGHFTTVGTVNGRTVVFLVDTGASSISMGASDADRLGIDYRAGRQVRMNTANGVTMGWRVKLASVRIGDVEIFDTDAVVGEQPMPYLLLGNSFLNRFTMRRDHEQMVLERRY